MSSNREARKGLGIAGRSELRGPMPVPKKKKMKKSPSESASATSGASRGSASAAPAGPKRNGTTAQAKRGTPALPSPKQTRAELERIAAQIAKIERQLKSARQARIKAMDWVVSADEMQLVARIERLKAKKRTVGKTLGQPAAQTSGAKVNSRKKSPRIREGLPKGTTPSGARRRATFIS